MTGFTAGHALSLGGREYYGKLVEQFVVLELEKQSGWSHESFRSFHFRDLDGLEVDIVIELADGRLLTIEVKSASSVTAKAWANLARFKERYADREVIGVCLHAGTRVGRIQEWLYVLPITSLWRH